MALGDRAKAGVLKRIAASAHSLTIIYPPKRTAATGVTLPMAPLTGPLSPPTLLPGATPTPEKTAVTLKCLWYDSPTASALGIHSNKRSYGAVAWRQGAVALARVAVKDAALDATKPYEKTVFDECETVQHAGLNYRVLGVTRSEAGNALPYTYYVWLATSEIV